MAELPEHLKKTLGAGFRIDRDLGGGGMSHVYVAHDDALDRDVVVKVLHPDLVDRNNLERFAREIRMAAKLSHPHIVPLLTAGESAGRPFYMMPLVKGQSLRERLTKDGPMGVAETVRILRDVATALGYAHEHGIVHRDIKPDNILLTGDSAAVTDFGVAKALTASNPTSTIVTSMGVTLGTPAYMAPEQAAGDPHVDGRADLYALGVTAFEMLGGRCPFDGRTVQATLAAHISEPPPDIRTLRVGLPERLSDLIMRCLQKDPAMRPKDAGAVVRALDALADPAGDVITAPVTPVAKPATSMSTGMRNAVIVGALVMLMVAGYYALRDRLTGAPSGDVPAIATSVSVAVLPFSGGGDTTDTYLREGIAEQIMGALSRVPGVRVASRMSTFAFQGRTDVSTADIGKQLNVQNVLEGTVRRDGDRLRVFAQLTNVTDGIGLWSETFEFSKPGMFLVQDSIARMVLERLRVKLGGAQAPAVAHRGTPNPEAYDLYLRARYQFNKFDEGPLRESIKLYDQALELDPRYADAWAGIAVSWLFLADDYVAPSIAYPAVRRAAEQAISLDSMLADAHAARGSALLSFDHNFPEARREIQRAVDLDPNSFIALISQQAMFVATGKTDSALIVLQRGLASDPLSPLNALLMGRFFGIVGRYDEAIAQYQRVVQLAPPLAPIAMIPIAEAQAAQGKKTEADSTVAQVKAMLPPEFHFMLANAEAAVGHTAEARKLVAQLEAVSRQHYVRPELIATVYARLGDRDKAFAWLEKAFEAKSPYLFALHVDKQWDPLRGDPRFAALEARLAAISGATK